MNFFRRTSDVPYWRLNAHTYWYLTDLWTTRGSVNSINFDEVTDVPHVMYFTFCSDHEFVDVSSYISRGFLVKLNWKISRKKFSDKMIRVFGIFCKLLIFASSLRKLSYREKKFRQNSLKRWEMWFLAMCQKFRTFMWTKLKKNLLFLERFFFSSSEKLTYEKENVILFNTFFQF